VSAGALYLDSPQEEVARRIDEAVRRLVLLEGAGTPSSWVSW